MSATNSTFGIRHPTVVPTNFEPAADELDEEDRRAADPVDSSVESE